MDDEKLTPEDLLASEQDILRGLLDAAEDMKSETTAIEIARRGRVLFRFRIRPLTESEYHACREKATKYIRNRQLGGIKLPEDTNVTRYRSYLIYEATVPEDRKAVWDNKEAWDRLSVITGPDLIEKVLKAGEKEAVIAKLDAISAFDSNLEDVAKNL